MIHSDSEKIASKIINCFNVADLDHHKIQRVAQWVKFLATVPVMAKIIYFCERILDNE